MLLWVLLFGAVGAAFLTVGADVVDVAAVIVDLFLT